jgi:hypothetical protein
MRLCCAVLFAAVVSASAFSQSFNFECQPPGALPSNPAQACDGVVSNNLGAGSGVTNATTCGFPVSGLQYLSLTAAGPVASNPGGPLPRPVSGNATEVRIPIPAGSSIVSLSWNFFNAEGSPQTTFNDGVSIDIVDASGAAVANLAYADTNTALSGSACSIAGEIAPAGVKAVFVSLPASMPSCSYVSIAVWNGGDNSYSSKALIDNVAFDSSAAGCAVPCIPVGGAPSLAASSPFGIPGSLLVSMNALPAGGTYLLAVTFNAGTYPNGWFYGLDIPISDLGAQINAGFPFSGPISSAACSLGQASIGPFFGAPTGLTFYAVAVAVPAGSLAGSPTAVTNTVSYTIP